MASRRLSFVMNEDIVHLRAHVIRNFPGQPEEFRVHNWYNLKENDRVSITMHDLYPEDNIKIELFYHYTVMAVGNLMVAISETSVPDNYLINPIEVISNFLEVVDPILDM